MHLRRKKSKTEVVRDRVSDLADSASDLASRTATSMAPHVEDARSTAGSAWEKAGTKLRDEIVPKVKDDYIPLVRDEYAPKLKDAAAPVVASALTRAQRKSVAVQDKAQRKLDKELGRKPQKKHRLRKLLVLVGLGGAGAFVAKKLASGGAAPLPPPPAPRPHPVPDPKPTAKHQAPPAEATSKATPASAPPPEATSKATPVSEPKESEPPASS
ncbi:MAG: hypothetical protein ACRDP1_17570 [Nocardioidaceae bacterium]